MQKRLFGFESEYDLLFVSVNGDLIEDENAKSEMTRRLFSLLETETVARGELEAPRSRREDEWGINGDYQIPTSGYLLPNGGRVYHDMGTIEYCSPECTDPREVVLYDRAADAFCSAVLEKWRALCREDKNLPKLWIFKKNTGIVPEKIDLKLGDATRTVLGPPTSRGFHESYLTSRICFDRLIRPVKGTNRNAFEFTPEAKFLSLFLLVRALITGSGGIVGLPEKNAGIEEEYSGAYAFVISPRLCCLNQILFETTVSPFTRALLNTRDEVHSRYSESYARLHLICSDANMMEKSVWLTFGLTSLMLELIEEDAWDEYLGSSFPKTILDVPRYMDFFTAFSQDYSGRKLAIPLVDGTYQCGLEILWRYYKCAKKYVESKKRDCYVPLLYEWKRALIALGKEGGWQELVGVLGWPTLKFMLEEYGEKDFSSEALHHFNFDFHSVDPLESEYYLNAGEFERVTTDEEIFRVKNTAPESRAKLRLQIGNRLKELGICFDFGWETIVFRDPTSSEALIVSASGTPIKNEVRIYLSDPFATSFSQLDADSRSAIKKIGLE